MLVVDEENGFFCNMQLASVLNKHATLVVFAAVVWIALVLAQHFAGIYFINELPNVILQGSAVGAFAIMAVAILLCKMSKVLKVVWLLFVLLLTPVFLFWLFIFSTEVDSIIHYNHDQFHEVIRSEPLGSARLVVYNDDFGATTPSEGDATLERDICPWLKKVTPINGGGSDCYFELTRIDAHHIKCVSKCGTDASYYVEEIVTDL